MTKQAKSDEEIEEYKQLYPAGIQHHSFAVGYKVAESELLPIINQQAEEIEKLQIQLAACGVGALSNTISAISSNRITPDNPYYSASLSDVYRAVDREIALREEIETLKAELSAKNTALGIDKEKILESMLELEKEKDALKEEIEKRDRELRELETNKAAMEVRLDGVVMELREEIAMLNQLINFRSDEVPFVRDKINKQREEIEKLRGVVDNLANGLSIAIGYMPCESKEKLIQDDVDTVYQIIKDNLPLNDKAKKGGE